MAFKDLELHSKENPDWGFARNKRAVLMVPSAEWVQSIFSCQFRLGEKIFIAPNRDYPYEGLMVYQDGENWKLIDCIAIGLQSSDGQYIPFVEDSSCPRVQLNPWSVSYHYKAIKPETNGRIQEIPFTITYYLHSAFSSESVTGCYQISFPSEFGSAGLIPIIQPFLDIRHMYRSSNFDNYNLKFSNQSSQVCIENYNRILTFYLPSGKINQFEKSEVLNWQYKLGVGERIESNEQHVPATLFINEQRDVAAYFNFKLFPFEKGETVKIFFRCHLTGNCFTIDSLEEIDEASTYADYCQLQEIEQIFNFPPGLVYRDAVLARIIGLTKFKIYLHHPDHNQYIRVPYAGAWWFKTPWYRDVFEGILNSFQTLMKIPEEKKNIKNIISIALSSQNYNTGLILNRIPEFKGIDLPYDSSDATLLFFLTAYTYLRESEDTDLEYEIISSAIRTITSFCRFSEQFLPNGPPQVDHDKGLILSTPHHSWIDTRSQSITYRNQQIEHLPSRASAEFIKNLYDNIAGRSVGDLLSSPCFFLPEINAQWILMLRGTLQAIDRLLSHSPKRASRIENLNGFKDLIFSLLCKAEQNFLPIFWNEEKGFLFNLVYKDGKVKDQVESEPGVVATALLGRTLFTHERLLAVWECVRTTLLIHRRLVLYGNEILPFGILTKNEGQQIYYNDAQYHSDVVWLRSTPYLLKLLRMLELNQIAQDVLINTLDHQMTEGAVFYNHELFSKPVGNNPYPDQHTYNNPVPVKNPIQFWSQWCDPMLDLLKTKETTTKETTK